jgi:ketosteroid isomerase-like protein
MLAAAAHSASVAAEPPAGPAAAMAKQNTAAADKALVDGVLRAWMTGDGGALQALLSDDIEWTIAGNTVVSGTTRGRAELMAKVLGPFGARFALSDDRFRPRQIHAVYADGDTVIVHFDGAGTANDGKLYSNSYLWLLTMSGGKVVRATAFFDSIAFNEFWRRVAPAG